jgi:hypothetical protein
MRSSGETGPMSACPTAPTSRVGDHIIFVVLLVVVSYSAPAPMASVTTTTMHVASQ